MVPSNEPPQSAKAQLASKLKLTIVHAWKERWSEIQWTIQLKKLLAAYSNESVDVAGRIFFFLHFPPFLHMILIS